VTGAELCERLFQSTPPARGGATADSSSLLGMVVVFQSTPPARGATSLFKVGKTSNALFQSTPPARGATAPLHHGHAALGISIHAPREGGDRWVIGGWYLTSISIHAPREGGDGR